MLKIITDLLTGAALLDELDHDLLGVIARILGQSLGDHQKAVSIGLHKQKRNIKHQRFKKHFSLHKTKMDR